MFFLFQSSHLKHKARSNTFNLYSISLFLSVDLKTLTKVGKNCLLSVTTQPAPVPAKGTARSVGKPQTCNLLNWKVLLSLATSFHSKLLQNKSMLCPSCLPLKAKVTDTASLEATVKTATEENMWYLQICSSSPFRADGAKTHDLGMPCLELADTHWSYNRLTPPT